MDDLLVVAMVSKFLWATVGLIAIMLTLRAFNKLATPFSKWIGEATSRDLSVYYSARFVGVCLYYGLAIS